MPTKEEFVAHNRTEEEIGHIIGADWLAYQALPDLKASVSDGNERLKSFDCSVFDGDYVTGDIDAAYLERLSLARNDQSKSVRESQNGNDHTVIELHNHA